MATQAGTQDLASDRAIRLFTYLQALSALRTTTVRTVDRYETVIWLADLPREPGCYTASWFDPADPERADVWVEIGKPTPPAPPPRPPLAVAPWLDAESVADSALEVPPLRHPTAAPVGDAPHLAADGQGHGGEPASIAPPHPAIVDQWDRYVREAWQPWAAADRARRTVQAIYADLFAIYQRQQRFGEQYEAVLAVGLLHWQTPRGRTVRRHLVTAQTAVAFDPRRGTLTIGPAGEGAKPALEQEMLDATERPEAAELRTVEQELAALGDDLWQKDRLAALLAAWVHAVSPRGRYEDDPVPAATITDDPLVRLAPAVILRRREERSLVRTYQDVTDYLDRGGELPLGMQRLVDIVDDAAFAGTPPRDGWTAGAADDEIFFPLPANDEQREIVARLRTRQGVLVQGPPGTGKSHTIANLVSHLLATGRRVLVTSHTPRALRVLRDKLPAAIAPLCVTVLGDDGEALHNLEDSVRGITDRFNHWDERRSTAEIEDLERQLAEARRDEAAALAELARARELETAVWELPFGGYTGTPETIARRVAGEAASCSWLVARPDETDAPPLSNAESRRLLDLLREAPGSEVTDQGTPVIVSPLLVPPRELEALFLGEQEARECAEATRGHWAHPAFDTLRDQAEYRERLRRRLEELQVAVGPLLRHREPWVRQGAAYVLSGKDRDWRQLQAVTATLLREIESERQPSLQRQVTGVTNRNRLRMRDDAAGLLRHLEGGGTLGVGPFRPEPVRRAAQLIESVRVDGRRCDELNVLRDFVAWCDAAAHLDELDRRWADPAESPSGPLLQRAATFRRRLATLDRVVATTAPVSALRDVVAGIPGMPGPYWYAESDIQAMLALVDAAAAVATLATARQPLQALADRIEALILPHDPGDALIRLRAAVGARDIAAYTQAYQAVFDFEEQPRRRAERDALQVRLAAAAHSLAAALEATAPDAVWDSRLAAFEAAWDWARADRWLERLHEPRDAEGDAGDLRSHRDRVDATIGRLAAARAWRHCFLRMTPAERMHLMAWMSAMRRIGRGSGKHAPAHRRAAREHMDHCRSAIPAWIMPIYRVAETVPPQPNSFDVVIIDEASQSGPEALFLLFIARQIVVVGDDKQISPEFVGVSREEVDALRARHIADVPFQDALGVDNSLFDQAVIRFGGRIRLREHFRSMPEIIQFSNEIAYQSEPLIPLRRYGTRRLPPLKTTHVRDGYRQGTGSIVVNPPEARAIVDQIVACCADHAYDGASLGVISLQGDAQARLIEALLFDAVGADEIERRGLVCGDASAFQGDERDVIFLSLVAAPTAGRRIGTLSSPRDERRFNVAASRARDQAWLFHTATLDDLSPACLRYRMLAYYLGHAAAPLPGEIEVPDGDQVVPPFDRLLEQDVFRAIRNRGWLVRTHVEIAGYRIDLVVEGQQGGLAVVCEGQHWHGRERYGYDLAQQRALERCGWTFCHVRGSAFYRNPEGVLRELRNSLDRLGITGSDFLRL